MNTDRTEERICAALVDGVNAEREASFGSIRTEPGPNRSTETGLDGTAFDDLVLRRQSYRRFATADVDLEVCAEIAQAVHANHERIFGFEPTFEMVFARPTGGSDSPAYRAGRDSLVDLGVAGSVIGGQHSAAIDAVILDRWQARAPMTLLFFADLAAAAERWGVPGYANSLVQIGAALDAAWLRAIDGGLVCCPFGAVDGRWGRALSRGQDSAVKAIVGLAIGHPQ